MSRERFYQMLDQVLRIDHLWDREKHELKVNLFEKELGIMSTGEVHLAKFFASLWFNNNKRYGFDLVDAVATLDSTERKLIIDWVANPFWP